MNQDNPYQLPGAELLRTEPTGGLVEPRALGLGRGLSWIGEGFSIFGRGWLIWIVNALLLLVIYGVLSFIPLVSLLANVLAPVFTGGLLLGCRAIEQGEGLEVGHLFAGFSHRSGTLAAVGGLYLLGLVVIGAIVAATAFGMGAFSAEPAWTGAQLTTMFALPGLVGLALVVPLIMALWFAPALVVFHGVDALEAMKRSFIGCLRNILPFLLYGLVSLVLLILAVLPLGLGLLVVMPVFCGSLYAAYKDIFLAAE